MEKIMKMECVEVEYSNQGNKCTLSFYDTETGELREVSYNLQKYNADKKKFYDDAEQKARVEKQIAGDTGLTFDTLDEMKDKTDVSVYCYDKFASLHHVDMVDKFTVEDKGDIFTTPIKDIFDDGKAIKIRYEHDDKLYESKMAYAKYIAAKKIWAVDPVRRTAQYENFEKKFLVPFAEKDSLIGKTITVEVRLASDKWPYGEIKQMRAKK